jgi:hypothetical protein
MVPSRGRVILLAVTVLLVLTATSVVAGPPPQPLCEACSGEVLNHSDVEKATVAINVDESGVGHRRIKADLAAGAAVDREKISAAATDTLRGHRGESEPRNLSVAVHPDSVVMTYEIPEMGHRSVGDVLVVDYFYQRGEPGRRFVVNAERIVLTGPDGTTLTRGLDGASTNDSAIVFEGSYGDRYHAPTESIGEQPGVPQGFVAFAQAETLRTTIATYIGVGIAVASAKASVLPDAVMLPTLVLAAFLVFTRHYGERLSETTRRRRYTLVGALASALAVGSWILTPIVSDFSRYGTIGSQYQSAFEGLVFLGLLVGAPSVLSITAVVGLQYLLTRSEGEPTVPPEWVRDGAVVLAGLALLGGIWAAGNDTPVARLYGSVVGWLVALLFMPLGMARTRRVAFSLTATILAAPTLVILGMGPFGYIALYFPLTLVPWALVVGSVGTLTCVYGQREFGLSAG